MNATDDLRVFCVSCGRLYKLPLSWWLAIDDRSCVCGEGEVEIVNSDQGKLPAQKGIDYAETVGN